MMYDRWLKIPALAAMAAIALHFAACSQFAPGAPASPVITASPGTHQSANASPAQVDSRIQLRGPFVPFGLCMSGMSAADQVAYCQKIGYRGLGLATMDAAMIGDFAKLPDVVSGKFRIYSVLWWYTYNDPIDLTWLDGILDDAKKMGMALWPVADWNGGDHAQAVKTTVDNFKIIAKHCQDKGVQMVLYPHVGCVFETAEQALEIQQELAKAGYPDVKISIHLCHELKSNNQDRLAEIVKKVAPYLGLASVSGANADTYNDGNPDYWSTAIMPLDEGSYDVGPFLKSLADNGYAGPVELHTYALKDPSDAGYDQHLERSFAKYYQLVVPPGIP